MAGPGLSVKKRLLATLMIFSMMLCILMIRVGWVQIVKGEDYQKQAYEQQTRGRIISPKRGTIYDRNGKELAISASVETISVNPAEIRKSKKDPEMISIKLSEWLQMDKEKVLKKVTASSRYEIVKRKVDKEIGDQIRQWKQQEKIEGVYVDEDSKRFYPNRNLASHVIGFTGGDNQGLGGIEAVMEQYLKGVPGKILTEVDARGRGMPFSGEKHIDAQDGLNVVLTIDEAVQHFAEKALEKAIDDNKVLNGAAAIIMDPRNGEILAMASKPDFDLNNPMAAPPNVDASNWKGTTSQDIEILQKTVWRNKAVVDTYEPGSTFKAFTSAAGLEENVIRPDSPVTDATVTVGGWPINCWRPNAHGKETFTEGVYNSCNPVFVRVSQSLGVEKFYKYVKAFGFLDKTNLGLPGEAQSIFHKKPTEVDMAAASFGQRFQITPVQLITAYGAVANGGNLIRPHLVKEISDAEGNIVKKFEPEVVRNVISKKTSDELKEILEGVVSIGTGKNAYVKGYRVAGKTGTSETTETKSKGRYIASFSAFAPADNPVICALVILDHPNVYPHTGGMIAAPVAGKLVEDVLNYLGVERRYSEKDKETLTQEVYVPDLRNKSIEESKKALTALGLGFKVEGSGNNSSVVVDQIPKPNASISQKSVVILYTYQPDRSAMVKVPDLKNKTVSEATQMLADLGLNIKVNGMGTAVNQSHKAGAQVPKGEVVQVDFLHQDNIEDIH
ncbi:MAG: penicillin-binding transpeptidase domain-containing protein [Clostridia bacterium]|nr:penicillin-binding transpeptidase domain-containing protein [Clostridia bacterium]